MLIAAASCCPVCVAANLSILPEHLRPDPFGGIVAADRAGEQPLPTARFSLPRNAYASFHILVKIPESGSYRLALASPAGLEVTLYREWFHRLEKSREYYPDALVPVSSPYTSRLPEPDNAVAGQTVQAFWVDVWAPRGFRPALYSIKATLTTGGRTSVLPIPVRVLDLQAAAEDAVIIDHNSYGTHWFAEQYPSLLRRVGPTFYTSDEFFRLIHAYHRIFYEHHGTYHQLGYGHAGKVGPEFAPALEGSGTTRRIASWALYDRHYGPLFNGSAFAGTHRGAQPIPFVYLPINPEWPASFEWWGEPGYQREFVNVVSEMEEHFRQKGWTSTRFEVFFNHKKRYKGFAWDGDEARFVKDYDYLREYSRLLKLAVPPTSPVKFVFRADASWTMERQWQELAGTVNFWVCGGGMFSWYPNAPQMLRQRGDIVWTYGGTPLVSEPSSHITLDVLRAWMQGVGGFVRWETTAPGPDPWFHFAGGGENMVYPGDRFGLSEPIASIRLKLERNAVQDISLLTAASQHRDVESFRRDIARAFNQTDAKDWWSARPALADTNPEEWSNADIEEASAPSPKFKEQLDSGAWQRARTYIFQTVAPEAR